MTEETVIGRAIKMFDCDTARISKPCGRFFLVIGFHRNTDDDPGYWVDQDGQEVSWDYVREQVIASGDSLEELMKSARYYKRISRRVWPCGFQVAA